MKKSFDKTLLTLLYCKFYNKKKYVGVRGPRGRWQRGLGVGPHFSSLSEKKGLVAVVGGRVGIWSFGSFLLYIIFFNFKGSSEDRLTHATPHGKRWLWFFGLFLNPYTWQNLYMELIDISNALFYIYAAYLYIYKIEFI